MTRDEAAELQAEVDRERCAELWAETPRTNWRAELAKVPEPDGLAELAKAVAATRAHGDMLCADCGEKRRGHGWGSGELQPKCRFVEPGVAE